VRHFFASVREGVLAADGVYRFAHAGPFACYARVRDNFGLDARLNVVVPSAR